MNKTIKRPTKLKDLFTDESKWTKGAFARDKEGKPCFSKDEWAVCFCLDGGINYCYSDNTKRMVEVNMLINNYLQAKKYKNGHVYWNDDPKTTFKQVKNLVNKLDI